MVVKSQFTDFFFQDEIQFLSRDEELYPQLMRLCLDFDFRVFALCNDSAQTMRHYIVAYKSLTDTVSTQVTPAFESLAALEHHTNENIIDILHDTLFDSSVDTSTQS